MSKIEISCVEISCKTNKAIVVLYIDIENEVYYSKIYNYTIVTIKLDREDRVQPIPPTPLNKLKAGDVIEYFGQLKPVAREFEISDSLISVKYSNNDFTPFADSIYFIIEDIKKKIRE